MAAENQPESNPHMAEYSISANGLKGAQSVRATFRLPDKTIKLLAVMARQLGLQQKSLFDQLMEDSQVLQQIAATAHSASTSKKNKKRQKTFVLSKKSLEILDHVARDQNIPRDILVEISIRRLLPVMNTEQEKHRKRKQLHKKVGKIQSQLVELSLKAKNDLGADDQASQLLSEASQVLDKKMAVLETILEKGQAMEDY